MKRIIALVAALLAIAGPAKALDCSGTITTGGTAQTIFTAVVRNVIVMNNSANLMCVAFNGVTASIAGTNCAAGSYVLQPGSGTTAGGSFSNPANMGINQVSIISSSTGDRFSCDRQ
jgi:hypothetical protein